MIGYTRWLGDSPPGAYYTVIYEYVLTRNKVASCLHLYRYDATGNQLAADGKYFWYPESGLTPRVNQWIAHKARLGPTGARQHHADAKYPLFSSFSTSQ